jgi:uncharacterized protein (TIGR00251 family)
MMIGVCWGMSEESFTLVIKAVPGARRDEVVGWLGERLKVRVSAPPEDGRANAAICALVARELGLKSAAVEVVGGHGRAEKTLRIRGASLEAVTAKWPRARA